MFRVFFPFLLTSHARHTIFSVCVRKVVVVVTRPRRGEAGVGGGDVSELS